MTSIPKDPRVSELRELFRNLEAFRTVYETTGMQEVITPAGNTWHLWDLEYLYRATSLLTSRQRQAITLYLVHNIREKDAARMMGVSETNPVAMYATLGLRRLLDLMESGALERFQDDGVRPRPQDDPKVYLNNLASFIKTRIKVRGEHCWTYPCQPGKPPVVLVRTQRGPMSISPAHVLYEALVEPIPRGFTLIHSSELSSEFEMTCINPWHSTYVLTDAEKKRLRLNAIRIQADIEKRSDHVRAMGAKL